MAGRCPKAYASGRGAGPKIAMDGGWAVHRERDYRGAGNDEILGLYLSQHPAGDERHRHGDNVARRHDPSRGVVKILLHKLWQERRVASEMAPIASIPVVLEAAIAHDLERTQERGDTLPKRALDPSSSGEVV